MNNSNCNDGRCDTPQKSQCNTESSCTDKKDCCSSEGMMCKIVGLAECAKKDLLKEKMKTRLESRVGKKLDKIADLGVDTLIEMYNSAGDCQEKKAEATAKLEKIMSE